MEDFKQVNLWEIHEETFDATPKPLHSQETVFSVGNGYFATRGTFEETFPRQTAATLLFGVFDTIPIAKEELANAPDWTPIKLFVNNERFRLDQGTILGYRRTLNLRNGVLSREVRWESPQGIRLKIKTERFASLADQHVGIIRYHLTIEETPEDKLVEVSLRAAINTAVGNYDVMHWESLDEAHDGGILWITTETKKSRIQLAQTLSFSCDNLNFQQEFVDSDVAPSIRLDGRLAPGGTLLAEKLVVMYTSRDNVTDPTKAAITHHQQLIETVPATNTSANPPHIYESLLAQNEEAWSDFWDVADIILEGDEKAQLGLRFNLFQLRINASLYDDRYSIGAKGLTGFGYRGHVFHDTEIFMLPFFTYVLPNIARNLLMYRYHLLSAARQKAASAGYEGAQYPWESTLNGEETTPPAIIHPETGELIPVLNGFLEIHITASISHAVWTYWRVTGDDEFMRDYGAEILISTALFWASRVEKNQKLDQYEITNVIGPDEWHEHVDNNSFTNYMARQNIIYALHAIKWLYSTAPTKARDLEERFHLTAERLEYWKEITNKLHLPQNKETGRIEQFDGFFKLLPFDQTEYKGRKDSYQGILGVEEVQHYQIIKQADVLMLLTVLLQEFDRHTKEINWNYYYPITDHDYGSSLTPALHVILASELGHVTEAYDLFMKGALVDIENLRGNTPEGIHAACAGAVWQATILGFAGLRVTEEGYTTNPIWPNNWTRLAFKFRHKGQLESVDLHR